MGIIGGLLILGILVAVVEILSVALKLTGLDIEKARFQVISIITNTGFTTKESELITQHPVRRRIAQILMLISYISYAALIGLVLYIIQSKSVMTYVTLGIVIVVVLILILLRKKWLGRKVEYFIERQLIKRMQRAKKYKTVEEVLKLNADYGVAEILIENDSPLEGKPLKNSGLSERDILVLNVDRGSHMIHSPTGELLLLTGDKVIVYGHLDNIKAMAINQYTDTY